MNKPYPFTEINSALAGAKNVAILLPDNPDYDLVASSLALFLSFQKAGKPTSIASSSPMKVELSHLVGLNKITTKIGCKGNFTISIDYPLENLEKVTLPDNTKTVNLIFKLKNGVPPIPNDKINFDQGGQEIDLYFLIGGDNLASFEKLVDSQVIQSSQNIAIRRQQTNLGKIQIIDSSASSYSEIITAILVSLSLPSDQDIAQNLFLGLSRATANFSSQTVSADTFEAAALCLRAGAKRELRIKVPAQGEAMPIEEKIKSVPPSPDWLQPKIYRGTSLT